MELVSLVTYPWRIPSLVFSRTPRVCIPIDNIEVFLASVYKSPSLASSDA
jgi:hypothetical protein